MPKEQTIDSRYNSFKCQLTDVIDSLDRSLSPQVPIRTTESLKMESHIEAKCSVNNKRRSGKLYLLLFIYHLRYQLCILFCQLF